MASGIQSAEDFSVESIRITSERFREALEIKKVTIELNIFENIRMPYLTGSILILDDNGLYTAADFQGTERLQVDLSLPADGAVTISKTFIMNRIEKVQKSNDQTAMLLFNLIEDCGFYNNVQSFSKSYDGKGEQIISKILTDKLGKSLYSKIKTYRPSYQSAFRIIVPYLKPFQAVKMALDKMTTENGSPYFLYSSLNTNDLILADLDTIMTRTAFNATEAFRFDQNASNDAEDIIKQSTAIYNVSAPNQEDTMLLSELGALGANFTTTDMTTGEEITYNHNVNSVYKQLLDAAVISSSQDNVLLDNAFIADPNGVNTQSLGDYNSVNFSQVGGGRTYPYQSEIQNWTYEDDPSAYKLKMFKHAIEQLLMKNNMELLLPGLKFLTGDVRTSVGNQISIMIIKNDLSDDVYDKVDNKRSGDFIINTKRHIFNVVEQSHTVSLSCSRISNRRIT
jgi:hypothetical protein